MEPFQLSEPFVGPEGDTILRSVDGVHFHIFRAILVVASPFFRTLFSLPQPRADVAAESTDHDDLPVVDVGEDSTALDIALRYCYPVRKPKIKDIAVVDRVLAAGLKYEIDVVVESMQSLLVSKPVMANQPIRAYLIACKHNLRAPGPARAAAKATLAHPIFEFNGKELDEVSARPLLRLFHYRKRVATRICDIFDETSSCRGTLRTGAEDIQQSFLSLLLRQSCVQRPCNEGCGNPAKFWVHYATRAVPLISEIPHTDAIFEDKFLQPISDVIRECERCRDSHDVLMWCKNLECRIRHVYDGVADSASVLTKLS